MKRFLALTIFLIIVVLCLVVKGVGYRVNTILDGSNATIITTNVSGRFTNTLGGNNVILGLASVATNTATTSTTNALGNVSTTSSQVTIVQRPVLISSTTVAFFSSFRLVSGGTTNVSFVFDKSYDGTNWENITTLFTLAGNGTNTVSGWTNLTIGDFGYIRIRDATNGNAAALTNCVARFYSKE